MRSRIYSALLAGALVVSALPGCGQKLSPEQRSILGVAALAAKERAVSFDALISNGVSFEATSEISAEQIARYVRTHQRQLNSEAALLNDLVLAVNDTGRLSERAKEMLSEHAQTAASRAENFSALSTRFRGTPAVLQYIEVHTQALRQQAEALQRLASSFPPKTPARAEVVAPESK
jgi:hypothetical protein